MLPPFALLAAAAAAAPAAPEPTPVHWYDTVTVSGYVDVYYGWATNRPLSGAAFTDGAGTTAKRSDEFSLNLAAFDLALAQGPVSLRLVLNYGTSTEIVHGAEPTGAGIGREAWKLVQQAYVGYRFDVRSGLLIEGGIFPSHIGFEVLPSKDNWTYTRAFMSDYSPYYQAGVRALLQATDALTLGLHVLNGWQVIGENNEWKTLGTQLAWRRPGGALGLSWNTCLGPEPATPPPVPGLRSTEDEWRLLSDLTAAWDLTPRLQLAATWDVGAQQRPGLDATSFHGGALYVRAAFLPERLFMTLRGEYYHDDAGAITGVAQTLSGATLTLETRAAGHLIVKLEGRIDHSTAPVFDDRPLDPSGLRPAKARDQGLFVLGAVATF